MVIASLRQSLEAFNPDFVYPNLCKLLNSVSFRIKSFIRDRKRTNTAIPTRYGHIINLTRERYFGYRVRWEILNLYVILLRQTASDRGVGDGAKGHDARS